MQTCFIFLTYPPFKLNAFDIQPVPGLERVRVSLNCMYATPTKSGTQNGGI